MAESWLVSTHVRWFDGECDFAVQGHLFAGAVVIGGPLLRVRLEPLRQAPAQPLVHPLVGRVGSHKALELVLNGFALSAAAAFQFGLIDGVMERPEFDRWLATLTSVSRVSQELAVEMLSIQAVTDIPTAEAAERHGFALSFALPDAAEGIRAFLEKRRPQFPR